MRRNKRRKQQQKPKKQTNESPREVVIRYVIEDKNKPKKTDWKYQAQINAISNDNIKLGESYNFKDNKDIDRKLKKIGERSGRLPENEKTQKSTPQKKYKSKGNYSDKQRLLSERQKELKQKATKEEIIFRGRLFENDIKHTFQKGVIDGKNFMIADFYIPDIKLIVEIDGGYHETSKQKARDNFKDKHYKDRGFSVIRIKNEDVVDFNFLELKKSAESKKKTEYINQLIRNTNEDKV